VLARRNPENPIFFRSYPGMGHGRVTFSALFTSLDRSRKHD
jgi:hypothetical protein